LCVINTDYGKRQNDRMLPLPFTPTVRYVSDEQDFYMSAVVSIPSPVTKS
jgi:hypothetical protein